MTKKMLSLETITDQVSGLMTLSRDLDLTIMIIISRKDSLTNFVPGSSTIYIAKYPLSGEIQIFSVIRSSNYMDLEKIEFSKEEAATLIHEGTLHWLYVEHANSPEKEEIDRNYCESKEEFLGRAIDSFSAEYLDKI